MGPKSFQRKYGWLYPNNVIATYKIYLAGTKIEKGGIYKKRVCRREEKGYQLFADTRLITP
jgi:hypothetical protein